MMKNRYLIKLLHAGLLLICFLAAFSLFWLVADIQIQVDAAPETLSFKLRYALLGGLCLFALMYSGVSISAAASNHQSKGRILAWYALPALCFLALTVFARYTGPNLTAEISRGPFAFLLKRVIPDLRDDAASLAIAVVPSMVLLLAVAVKAFSKAEFVTVRRWLKADASLALLVAFVSFGAWQNWGYNVYTRKGGEPNIVFIICDAMRADHLGGYGYFRETSPVMDQLAKEGVIFTNFTAASSWSEPSYIAMYSSQYPSYYRAKSNTGEIRISRELSKKDYYTHGFITNIFAYYPFGGTRATYDHRFISTSTDTTKLITDLALQMITRRARDKFFIHLQYMDPHSPYIPPLPEYGMFVDLANKLETPENEARRRAALYDGEIRWINFQISRIVSRLQSLGLYDNTYIVITADHGEKFDDPSSPHGGSLEDELLHVPLIIRGPGIPPNRRIDSPASHVDLLPTFMEWIGAEPAPDYQGKSLMPLIHGEEDADRIIFSELMIPAFAPKYHVIAVRKGPWKLITGGPDGDQLFNLEQDRSELVNLAEKFPDLLLKLKQDADDFKKNAPSDRAVIQYSPQEREVLKGLGYLQ
ncbi:MAG: hypothetical protein C4520_12515 [Candidatus Abyssobacteria bacterium SURF_5]|uniref:Sulfatase N-terminal domain-containing protein n=1 Tax=Abyssobacteria bacterium (strain SURF_5) TaxID=2093360 RepID=A0A3A4NMH3_ABYX5|nr:MAG: hypothetical protein C4520_12515 [Candidatus Abyssubacteria bacterium SURF_5]